MGIRWLDTVVGLVTAVERFCVDSQQGHSHQHTHHVLHVALSLCGERRAIASTILDCEECAIENGKLDLDLFSVQQAPKLCGVPCISAHRLSDK
jgi:hypothetical protein